MHPILKTFLLRVGHSVWKVDTAWTRCPLRHAFLPIVCSFRTISKCKVKDPLCDVLNIWAFFVRLWGKAGLCRSRDPITSAKKRWLCPHAAEPQSPTLPPSHPSDISTPPRHPLNKHSRKVCSQIPHTPSLRALLKSMPPGLTLVIFWSVWTRDVVML